ncbi:MFS transporter [Kribbella antibiotica]|uniref:MFS transporter n=1 Tax=Kribbella antibiotica TaxID=190195 RepID=A0A4R4YNJ0_9ACTN|nr:MFS transporter [Kribbella antibiotica]TDD46621.1 MFS transporter [Kribbella antibiotica]
MLWKPLAPTGDLALLRDSPFLLLLVGRFVAILASVAAPVALAFGVLAAPGGTPTRLSIVMACESIPLLAFVLVGGVIADRVQRSRVVVVGLVLSAVSFGSIGAMLVQGAPSWWLVGGAAAVSGIGIAVMNPALAAIVPELVPVEQLHAANSIIGVARNVARILGVVTAGLLVTLLGGGWTLVGCGTALLLAAAPFAFLRPRRVLAHSASGKSLFGDLRDGWTEFRSREWVWVVVLQSSLHFACYGAAIGVIGPALVTAELGGAKTWSWLLACESAGTLAGAVLALRWKPERTILASVIAVAVTMPTPFILLGLDAPLPAVLVAIFFTGVGMSLIAVLWSVTVQLKIPAHALSRVSSYDALGSLLMSPLALMLAGPAVALLGARPAMLLCGALLVVITASGLISRDVRTVKLNQPEPPVEEP